MGFDLAMELKISRPVHGARQSGHLSKCFVVGHQDRANSYRMSRDQQIQIAKDLPCCLLPSPELAVSKHV